MTQDEVVFVVLFCFDLIFLMAFTFVFLELDKIKQILKEVSK